MTKREIYLTQYQALRMGRQTGGLYLIVNAFQKLKEAFGELKATQLVLAVDREQCQVVNEVRSRRLRELAHKNRIRKQDEAPEMGADSSHAKVNVGV